MRIALVVPGGVGLDQQRVIPAILWLLERLAQAHRVDVVVAGQEREPGTWMLRGARVHNLGRRHRGWQLSAIRLLADLHSVQPFDVFHALWAVGPGEVAVAAARVCKRPVVVHVAGGELVWFPEIPFGTRRSWRRALARLVIRSADRVTAASQPMLDLIRERTGVEATRLSLGPDVGTWAPTSPRHRSPGEGFRLVSVGSLTPVKDHATTLRAVAELDRRGRSVYLDLVGEDTSGGAVPALIRELGLHERVMLHGFLEQAAARDVVRSAHAMVVASRHEAGPVAMLEAAAVGVPTLGTPVGHVVEWAPDAAMLIPFAGDDELANATAVLFDDDQRRMRLARAAQARALAEDADWTAALVQQVYQDLMSERPRG